MIEPEIAFGNVHDVMDLAEDYLKFVLRYVVDNNKDDMDFFDLRVKKGIKEYLRKIVETKFAKMTYTEVIEELLKVINNFNKYLLLNFIFILIRQLKKELNSRIKLNGALIYQVSTRDI